MNVTDITTLGSNLNLLSTDLFNAEADIVSNTAAIVLNTAKVSYTDAAAVALNTAKVTYDDAAAVALNTAKVTYDDAAAVALNTAKVSVPAGGTTGQVLSKVSATDYALQWSTAGGGGGGDVYRSGNNTFTGTNVFTQPVQSYRGTNTQSVTLGQNAGLLTQGDSTVAVGYNAAYVGQGIAATAIGYGAATSNQGIHAVAVGSSSGVTSQGDSSVAIGHYSGSDTQGDNSIAIGNAAAYQYQSAKAVAIGYNAGYTTQGVSAVAIGDLAGQQSQGAYSIALGYGASRSSQGANGVYINASGTLLDDSTPSHIHIASDTASLDYTTADGWAVTTPSGTVPVGNVSTSVDNTFTGTNSFTGVKNVAIAGNGSGTALPTAAIVNDVTQTITGAGNIYGQELPALVKDTGTYNITNPNLFGIGGLFIAQPTINLTAPGTFSVAGPFQSIGAAPTINKTHSSTQAFTSYPVWVRTTINNSGGGTMTAIEAATYVNLTLGTSVTAGDVSALTSAEPTLGAGSSIDKNMGVRVVEKVVGTYNVGYQYGTTVDTAAGNYAFDSSTSLHAVRFGGGVVNKVKRWASATDYQLTRANHTMYIQDSQGNPANLLLPPTAEAVEGQTYVIFNDHSKAFYLIAPSGSSVTGNTYGSQMNPGTGASFTCIGVAQGGSVIWVRS